MIFNMCTSGKDEISLKLEDVHGKHGSQMMSQLVEIRELLQFIQNLLHKVT